MMKSYEWESQSLFSTRVLRANLQIGKSALVTRANQLRGQGVDIVDLSGYVIDRPYGSIKSPPDYVFDAARKCLESGWPKPEHRGIGSFRQVIAKVEGKERGIDINPGTEVIVTGGGVMQGIYNVLQSLIELGDKVIIFGPGLTFNDQVRLAGGIPIFVELSEEDGYRVDTQRLEQSIQPGTKLMIFNTPHNPTGNVASRGELEEIAEVVKKHNLIVISDEILSKWVYDGRKHQSLASLPGMQERTIIVNSVTKAGMYDWRVGWIIGNKHLVDQLEKIMFWQNEFVFPVLQVAAMAHLEGLNEWIRPIVQEHQEKRNLMHDRLTKLGIPCFKPEGHLSMFPSVTPFEASSVKFAELLLEQAHVLTSPGLAYLGEGHLRLGFNLTSEKLNEGLDRIQSALESKAKGTQFINTAS
jgi:aspartate/methionine/tyrosine aminotransferase